MTITVAWIRTQGSTPELLVASDSRLRSHGALDQAQKLFLVERGDCCLGFCGDAQIAYPLSVQVGTSLNNHIRTRTRGDDVTAVSDLVGKILMNLVDSWDIELDDKARELASTRILLAGWSWAYQRYEIGYFKYDENKFTFHHFRSWLPHPFADQLKSFIFMGNYQQEYAEELKKILTKKHGTKSGRGKIVIKFDYEPLEALDSLLGKPGLPSIGGSPQLVKIYPYCSSLPFVIRRANGHHYLLGRKMFPWEKTHYPLVTLRDGEPATIRYPMELVPVPAKIGADLSNQ